MSTEPKTNLAIKPEAGLYLVATPIGNLRDITLRALDVLRGCDYIACEDTRTTKKLLSAYSIDKPLLSYHDHSKDRDRDALLGKVKDGASIAYVSDAGMPLISDPGFRLVEQCRAEGLHVTSIPGPTAPLMALQLSGLPTDSFTFAGFLPHKSSARRKMFEAYQDRQETLIFFESAKRLLDSLDDAQTVYGDRKAAICRELTKKFEEICDGMLSRLVVRYQTEGLPKGEIVLVIAGKDDAVSASIDDPAVQESLQKALKTMKTKEAAEYIAAQFGLKRKDVYTLALRLKE